MKLAIPPISSGILRSQNLANAANQGNKYTPDGTTTVGTNNLTNSQAIFINGNVVTIDHFYSTQYFALRASDSNAPIEVGIVFSHPGRRFSGQRCSCSGQQPNLGNLLPGRGGWTSAATRYPEHPGPANRNSTAASCAGSAANAGVAAAARCSSNLRAAGGRDRPRRVDEPTGCSLSEVPETRC